MSKQNLTATRVENAQCEEGKQQPIFWDAKTAGFGLRVTASGARAYIFESRLFGRSLRITIGDARSWDLAKARLEAARLKMLIDSGQDPREIRKAQAAAHEARKAETKKHDLLAIEAWNHYIAERRAKWSDRHYLDHVRLSEAGGRPAAKGHRDIKPGPLAPLLEKRLADLTVPTVDAWLAIEAESRPGQARLAFSALRAFIAWCQEQPEYASMTSTDVCTSKGVREHLPRAKAKNDCLQREQLAAWFSAVRALSNPVISAYLQGLLITGARREELAGLRWVDVDFKWRSLVLNDKIEGTGGRTIPLTPYFANLLLDLQHRRELLEQRNKAAGDASLGDSAAESPWVFNSRTSRDGKLAEPRLAHNRALTEAGLPHLSIHGLRRSFGTLAEWVEVPVGVIAQIQGHKPSAIAEKHYRRRSIDLLRLWHDKIEVWLLEQAGLISHSSSPVTSGN